MTVLLQFGKPGFAHAASLATKRLRVGRWRHETTQMRTGPARNGSEAACLNLERSRVPQVSWKNGWRTESVIWRGRGSRHARLALSTCCFRLPCCFRCTDSDEKERLRNRFLQKIVYLDGKVLRKEVMPVVGHPVPGTEWEDTAMYVSLIHFIHQNESASAGLLGQSALPRC